MATANEKLADAFIRRDLDLIRFLRGARRLTIARVDALARELQQLIYRFDPSGPIQLRHRELRIKRLLAESAKVIREAYAEIGSTHREQSRLLASLEGKAALAAINKGIGATVVVVPLTRSQVAAIANNAVITGTPLREWWATQAQSTYKRFAQQMRQGMLSGETVGQLTSRIGDTKGFLKLERYQAEALVRTGFQSVTNAARMETFQNNSDVVKGIAPRITFDLRTCPICFGYSGSWYSLPDFEPQGDFPPWNGGPPFHVQCRCSCIAVTKSWDELRGRTLKGGQGLPQAGMRTRFEASLRRQGLSEAAIERAVQNAKASMDGQIPEDWSFETWLNTKSPAQQKEVLGVGKWQLWQDGKIDLTDFVNSSGRILTLEELQSRS